MLASALLGVRPRDQQGRVGKLQAQTEEPSSALTNGKRHINACWEKREVWGCRSQKGSSGPISGDSKHLLQPSDRFPSESSKCLMAGVCLLPQTRDSVRARTRRTPSAGSSRRLAPLLPSLTD